MPPVIDVALVGAGGFGQYYLKELLHNHQDRVRLAGVIDPFPERCPELGELQARSIPIYPALGDFFAASSAQLVFISSPIHVHAAQTILALEHGASVLCEKPLCPTIQEAHCMAQAEAEYPGFVAIGYQWSFSGAIQTLKQDILRGVLGHPVRLKSRVYWPRGAVYFARNAWAGRQKTDDGAWVLDSPAGNAAAHYLHNMLYVLGETRETSAAVRSVQAELFRVNPIENYDTAAMRVLTESGAEILFYTTHASEKNIDPIFEYAFENAVVSFNRNTGDSITARFHDGREKNYGNPFASGMDKLWQSVEAVHTGQPLACGIEAAIPQVLCINGAQESAPAIIQFPDSLVHTKPRDGDPLLYIEGLENLLDNCCRANVLPSESGQAGWAAAGRVIDLRNYDHFPKYATQ
jgi:predicted dehydrogenase